AGAALYLVTDFYAQVGIAGEPEVGAGTEADHNDPFATGDAVANFFPADYAPGDQAGDLLEHDFAGVGRQGDDVLLVVFRSRLAHGGGKFAGLVVHGGDCTACSGTVDVHVPDGEKDADALPGGAGVLFIGVHDDAAVGRGDDGAGISRDDALRIAEEIKDECGEEEEQGARERPAQEQGSGAQRERRQPEVVAIFDHAPPTISQPSRWWFGAMEAVR